MGIKTFPQPPYSPDFAPGDFWLFPKLRDCRYGTIEEIKEAVTKVIDTLTQEDFDGAFQKLLEQCVCVCVHKQDLLLNNLQVLICCKTQPTNLYKSYISTKYISTYLSVGVQSPVKSYQKLKNTSLLNTQP